MRYSKNAKRLTTHRWRLRRLGWTLEQYYELLNKQHSLCAICKVDIKPIGFNTHLDHCHVSGKVRGILCGSCNRGLGQFKDNPITLAAAIVYLRSI